MMNNLFSFDITRYFFYRRIVILFIRREKRTKASAVPTRGMKASGEEDMQTDEISLPMLSKSMYWEK